MKNKSFQIVPVFAVLLLVQSVISHAAQFPTDKLPSYIKLVSEVGERCEWSKDAKKILYVTASGGDVEEVIIETGEVRVIAEKEGDQGYWRAYNLINGDYALLRGANRWGVKLVIVSQDLSKQTVIADWSAEEGIAVSRRNMTIAWIPNFNAIYTADIIYNNGTPELINKRKVVDTDNMPVKTVEPQDFRGPDEKELIFSCYGCESHEVYGIHLETGELKNYSNAEGTKEEPEGIFPSGKQTLIESDKGSGECGDYCVEIHAMLLDGTGENRVRLTFFQEVTDSDGTKFKASNPAVRNNGQQFCFQEAVYGGGAGVGQGIYVYDLREAGYQWLYLEDGAAIPPDTITTSTTSNNNVFSHTSSVNTRIMLRGNGIVLVKGETLLDIRGRTLARRPEKTLPTFLPPSFSNYSLQKR